MSKRIQNEADEILSYMSRWIREEDWDAMQCMANAASVGCPDAMGYMADYICGTGAIDSKHCYEDSKTIEQDIELLAKRFRKLSKKRRDLCYDRIFNGVLFVDCQVCNHVCFVHDGNEELYPEVTQKCWECKAEHLVVKRYKAKNSKLDSFHTFKERK